MRFTCANTRPRFHDQWSTQINPSRRYFQFNFGINRFIWVKERPKSKCEQFIQSIDAMRKKPNKRFRYSAILEDRIIYAFFKQQKWNRITMTDEFQRALYINQYLIFGYECT